MASDPAQILAILPQTQCTRCGYPDCAGYADAIAHDQAAINQCPPGGLEGMARLAALTGKPLPAALSPANGVESARSVAVIDEDWCIGCTLCIDACPTDAILGSNKRMHTVIEPYCTGCELCIPVCPVDCIGLENVTGHRTGWAAWSQAQADQARERYQVSVARRIHTRQETAVQREQRTVGTLADLPAHSSSTDPEVLSRKKAVIEAALQRAREKRGPA